MQSQLTKAIEERLEGIETAIAKGIDHTISYVVKIPTWLKILLAVFILIIAALLFTIFKAQKQIVLSNQKIDSLEMRFKSLEELNQSREESQRLRDTIIFDKLDQIKSNRTTQTRIIHEITQIPPDVRALDTARLREGIRKFRN